MNQAILFAVAALWCHAGLVQAETLPQHLPYQQQLRKFMAKLQADDFQPKHQVLKVAPFAADADERFRMWLLALQPHAVGRKRNYSSVMIKPGHFTLAAIEGPKTIMRPPAHPEPLVDLAAWNYPGNPYFGSRPLRLRAFVLCALDMIMVENLCGAADPAARPNQNLLAGAIARLAYTYPGVRDVLSAEARTAYLAGLRKLVERALDQGPTSVTPRNQGMYTWAAPALFLSAQVLNDADITKRVEAYARTILTTEPYFRGAGYFPNGGTLDSFNGISTYFAVWGALADPRPEARAAIARVYDLRGHLTLPEPDGVLLGPSSMGSLTSAESAHEQWNWPMRTWGAALIADEAACLTKMPDETELKKAETLVVGEINAQLQELSWVPGGLDPAPWNLQPAGTLVNFAYQYYPKGYLARRSALEKQSQPLQLPVLRANNFVRNFKDEFIVAKTSSHAAIVHVGPISEPDNPHPAFGFGGGSLCAFWTKATGSVILGRGIGAYSPQYKKSLEEWRSLPTHAVTGSTSAGAVVTSAHIVSPTATVESGPQGYVVTAHGSIPTFRHGGAKLAGTLDYSRKFESSSTGVRVTTKVKADGKDQIAELYETVPVFLREVGSQSKATPTAIELSVAGKWVPATESFTDKVGVVRLTRFGGAVTITFDSPRRIKLAPPWADTYQTRSTCRNLLIDMSTPEARTVSYRIEAGEK